MSRDKFESIYGPMGFDLTRMYVQVPEPWSEYEDEKTGYAWAGWLAGRESMRDEAAAVLANVDNYANPLTARDCEDEIRKIEP